MPLAQGRDPRYETLDVWRGVACLMVVLHHSGFALRWSEALGSTGEAWARRMVVGFVRQMDLGVPLFFVISGYCIAASMDGHRRRGASSWEFLKRRLRRIYPPYWAALLVSVGVTWSLDQSGLNRLHNGEYSLELDSPGKLDRAQWLGNVTLTEMWRPKVWGGSSVEVYTRVAWSLCYEEQFYLVCFLALLVAPRRLYGVLGVLTAAIVGFRVFAWDSGWLVNYQGMFPDLWHEFAVGLAVYWRLVAAPSKPVIDDWHEFADGLADRGRLVVSLSMLAKLAVALVLINLLVVGVRFEFRSTAVASAFGLALIALRGLDEAASRQAWLMPLRACGRRCYSIYLIHLPFCTVGNEFLASLGLVGFWTRVFVVIPIVSIVAVGAGWVFFAAIESKFLNTRRR
jgi:peptidoglycan/LPS O-acetylase OafA/YrhL